MVMKLEYQNSRCPPINPPMTNVDRITAVRAKKARPVHPDKAQASLDDNLPVKRRFQTKQSDCKSVVYGDRHHDEGGGVGRNSSPTESLHQKQNAGRTGHQAQDQPLGLNQAYPVRPGNERIVNVENCTDGKRHLTDRSLKERDPQRR